MWFSFISKTHHAYFRKPKRLNFKPSKASTESVLRTSLGLGRREDQKKPSPALRKSSNYTPQEASPSKPSIVITSSRSLKERSTPTLKYMQQSNTSYESSKAFAHSKNE